MVDACDQPSTEYSAHVFNVSTASAPLDHAQFSHPRHGHPVQNGEFFFVYCQWLPWSGSALIVVYWWSPSGHQVDGWDVIGSLNSAKN